MAMNNPTNFEYIRYMAKDALFNTKDVANIFHVTSNYINALVAAGKFPSPDVVKTNVLRPCCRPKHYWNKDTVLKAINEFKKLQS